MNLKKVRFFCCLIENFYSLLTWLWKFIKWLF
jgi:hypothetical protein